MDTEFRPNISNLDTGKGLEGFKISNGYNKGMNSVIFTVYHELSKNKSMSCYNS